MPFSLFLIAVVLAYLLGSFPTGLVLVRLATGQDVRQVGSGRTGGSNAWRAAGAVVGILTTLADIIKVTLSVWLAALITGGNHWAEALSGVASIIGHNASIFLAKRVTGPDGKTRLQFDGGAGGASTVGAAFGLWPLSVFVVVPLGVFVWMIIGYASIATMTVGVASILTFAAYALWWGGPPEYIAFGVLTLIVQLWALRPNLRRLMAGEEKMVSFSLRARLQRRLNSQPKQQDVP